MMHEKAYYKNLCLAGPGGRKCSCCYPQVGKRRAQRKRQDRKVERSFFKRLLQSETKDLLKFEHLR